MTAEEWSSVSKIPLKFALNQPLPYSATRVRGLTNATKEVKKQKKRKNTPRKIFPRWPVAGGFFGHVLNFPPPSHPSLVPRVFELPLPRSLGAFKNKKTNMEQKNNPGKKQPIDFPSFFCGLSHMRVGLFLNTTFLISSEK
jgi:hypothetical protein